MNLVSSAAPTAPPNVVVALRPVEALVGITGHIYTRGESKAISLEKIEEAKE